MLKPCVTHTGQRDKMDKIKVLFVINQLYRGGAETALLNLFRSLEQERAEAALVIYDQLELKDTISLIPQIPQWVEVFNASEDEKGAAFIKKAFFKASARLSGQAVYRQNVYRYFRDRVYDVAISYGEWFSSALVAKYVTARRKYVWIHADIDKASFLHPDIIKFHQFFDGFIFTSQQSRCGAVKRYPFLQEKSTVIHNMVNERNIIQKSRKEADGFIKTDGLPVLVTVANIREEKNHLRQVRVMEILQREGLYFHWINIGSMANREQTERIHRAVVDAGVQEYFHLLGALDNPYPYMCHANAVCVLSDHESWSMVITEAKALGVPVVATRTSGALEQIVHRKTGLLCDFSAEDIAAQVKALLQEPGLASGIRKQLQEDFSQNDDLRLFMDMLQNQRKTLLFAFDNINYVSGARNAALAELEILRKKADVTLFSAEPCRDDRISRLYRTVDIGSSRAFRCLSVPFREVMREAGYTWRHKIVRILYAVLARVHLEHRLYDLLLQKQLHVWMEGYDTVCVLSEASKLRSLVASLKRPQKIQWIHTDYAAWHDYNAWTRAVAKNDRKLYSCFDRVICLSERLMRRFLALFPEMREKTDVIPNPIQYEMIRRQAEQSCAVAPVPGKYNLITIGRMEREKRYDCLLRTAAGLKARAFPFHWFFVGGGELLGLIQEMRREMGLTDEVTLTGPIENPYPLLAKCDLLILASEYEGTPITVDEAKVLGVPVLSHDVGGISDQLEEGRFGCVTQENIWENPKQIEKLLSEKEDYDNKFTQEECALYNQEIYRRLERLL